jgi:hypothetical protein
MALGAGTWGQLYGEHIPRPENQTVHPLMIVTIAGAVLVMAAVWLGTSADPPIRVGSPGIGIDKSGNTRRIPWHALERLTWDHDSKTLTAIGKDEGGVPLTIAIRVKQASQAAAWVLKEAKHRAHAACTDLAEDLSEKLPEASDDAGARLDVEPMQVVGKRCAATNEIIAYEPDARVCPRCERVYHVDHMPDACACGEDLRQGSSKAATATPSSADAPHDAA